MSKSIAVFVKNLTSGGAEKQSVLLARSLAGYCDVHYVVFNGQKVHAKYLKMLESDARIKIAMFSGNHFKRFSLLLGYIRKEHIDVIFSYLTAANLYACMAAKRTGARVYTGLRNAELPFRKMFVDRFLANHWACKAVVNCYSGKANFVVQGFREERVEVIPNCMYDVSPFRAKPDSREVRVLTVGRFVRQKDYDTAISCMAKACAVNATLRFQIVGYGELEHYIREKVKEVGIESVTDIVLNPDNLSAYYDEASIYLSTSLFEGTSNSIMEAMNADLPVVATDVGDNARLVQHGVNGFLAPRRDAGTLSAAVIELAADAALRRRMGKEGKQHLIDNYTVEVFRSRYVALMEE